MNTQEKNIERDKEWMMMLESVKAIGDYRLKLKKLPIRFLEEVTAVIQKSKAKVKCKRIDTFSKSLIEKGYKQDTGFVLGEEIDKKKISQLSKQLYMVCLLEFNRRVEGSINDVEVYDLLSLYLKTEIVVKIEEEDLDLASTLEQCGMCYEIIVPRDGVR